MSQTTYVFQVCPIILGGKSYGIQLQPEIMIYIFEFTASPRYLGCSMGGNNIFRYWGQGAHTLRWTWFKLVQCWVAVSGSGIFDSRGIVLKIGNTTNIYISFQERKCGRMQESDAATTMIVQNVTNNIRFSGVSYHSWWSVVMDPVSTTNFDQYLRVYSIFLVPRLQHGWL
jgi:hypothetical protein